ncbi:AVN_HP_G0119740.mRNA.1.CDS.1 [Saccharomyces cerevisiae]|nr:AVN_HP_G0119740.mRNA.1.CDS.1 [Saccharomyces cerevisiae]CAI6996863.1 AVN_HP_G0119740.mRNA.1.CDS.1 [Saccharomyces cerevisiae]
MSKDVMLLSWDLTMTTLHARHQESPQFLQVGGGINDTNCLEWLKWVSKVIVTSWLFTKRGHFQLKRLERLTELCGKTALL